MKTELQSKNRLEAGLLVTLVATVLFVCFLTGGESGRIPHR